MMKKVLNKNGSIFLTAIGIFAIILVVTLFGMDVTRIYIIRSDIEMEMERCAISAVEVATADDYRAEHESVISESAIIAYFDEYIHERLRLNANNERCNPDGAAIYKLTHIVPSISASPAAMSVDGEIEVGFYFIKALCPVTIRVPFSASSSQIRLDEP